MQLSKDRTEPFARSTGMVGLATKVNFWKLELNIFKRQTPSNYDSTCHDSLSFCHVVLYDCLPKKCPLKVADFVIFHPENGRLLQPLLSECLHHSTLPNWTTTTGYSVSFGILGLLGLLKLQNLVLTPSEAFWILPDVNLNPTAITMSPPAVRAA